MWTPEDGSGGTLVVQVESFEAFQARLQRALASGGDPTPRVSFVSYDLMHRALAPKRLQIVQTMLGAGPLSIREIARRVGRDFKGVHTDIKALHSGGMISHTSDGKMIFPYDRIHFDFDVESPEQSAA